METFIDVSRHPIKGLLPRQRRAKMGPFESPAMPSLPANLPSGQNQDPAPNANLARWAELLTEMSALHAKLEYLNLMLRIGNTGTQPER